MGNHICYLICTKSTYCLKVSKENQIISIALDEMNNLEYRNPFIERIYQGKKLKIEIKHIIFSLMKFNYL